MSHCRGILSELRVGRVPVWLAEPATPPRLPPWLFLLPGALVNVTLPVTKKMVDRIFAELCPRLSRHEMRESFSADLGQHPFLGASWVCVLVCFRRAQQELHNRS